ncbi:MAG: DUF695 domain-containing protein [Planctomycetota bacterium]
MNEDVRQWMDQDRWSVVQGTAQSVPFVLRFREPALLPTDRVDYARCLRVVWAFDGEGSGAMPHPSVSSEMEVFEDRLCAAWEGDGLAVLTGVLTFDGARQWVFYTSDVSECGERLATMPQESAPYPIELDAFDDPTWHYWRNEIVGERGETP